jgi:penicillin-binding protein 2
MRMKPMVVQAIEDPSSMERQPLQTQQLSEVPVRDPGNWQRIEQAMTQVVHGPNGTARRISQGLQYKIAGKTGTAQVFTIAQDAEYDAEEVTKRLRDHALFTAFAPAEAPEIAVALIVENGGSGSAVAAPIARQVIDTFMQGREK